MIWEGDDEGSKWKKMRKDTGGGGGRGGKKLIQERIGEDNEMKYK